MKAVSILTFTICAAIFAAGCGQQGSKSAVVSQDNVGIMSSAIQLQLPDQSYSGTASPFAISAQVNERNLVNTVNTMALPLKESNCHFAQVVKEGVRTNGNLTITHATLNAQLTGVKDEKSGLINWTYKLGGTTYFSGQTNVNGTTGELLFPISALSARPITLRWEYPSKVTVRADAANYLEFVLDHAAPSVALSGLVNGTVVVKGKWTSTGGSYTEGENASARCWNSRLENTDCLN